MTTPRITEDAQTAGASRHTFKPSAGSGSGETNTGSNQGTDGVGVFDTKSGVDLQFRNVAPASGKITVVLNGKDIDVDLGAVLVDYLTDVDTTTDAPNLNEVLKWNGTNWVPGTAVPQALDTSDSPTFVGLTLGGLINGLIQANASGVLAALTGTTEDAILVWNAVTNQWEENVNLLITDTLITGATALTLASGSGNVTIDSFGGGIVLQTAAGQSISLNPGAGGNVILSDLASGVLLAGASGIMTALTGSVDNAPLVWDTATTQWIQASLSASSVVQTDSSGGLTTGVVTAPLVEDELKTYCRIFYIEDPSATDSYPLLAVPFAATITRVHAQTDAGTVDFNLEKRGETTPFTAGTNVFSTDETADSTSGTTITSFNSPGIAANEWLQFAASAVASSPTKLQIKITLEVD